MRDPKESVRIDPDTGERVAVHKDPVTGQRVFVHDEPVTHTEQVVHHETVHTTPVHAETVRPAHTVGPSERVIVQTATTDPAVAEDVRRDAYERGRAEERAARKRNPLLSILIALAAVLGLAVLTLYFINGGSFSGAGRDLDQAAGVAGEQAREAGRELADETGEGLQDLGRGVERQAEPSPAQPVERAPRDAPQGQPGQSQPAR